MDSTGAIWNSLMTVGITKKPKKLRTAQIIRNNIKIINRNDIVDTVKSAYSSPSCRAPILLNNSFLEKPQRFVNCLTKNTYVRPHNHMATYHWELMSWLDGVVYVILFDAVGNITDKIEMSYNGLRIVEIPPETYHSFITPDFGAYLEIRNCAYEPELDRDYAEWSPPEGSQDAAHFLAKLFDFEENGINCD